MWSLCGIEHSQICRVEFGFLQSIAHENCLQLYLDSERFFSLAAMAESQANILARYGTVKLQTQTNCDFIGDSTCVTVGLAETTDDKGEKMNHK